MTYEKIKAAMSMALVSNNARFAELMQIASDEYQAGVASQAERIAELETERDSFHMNYRIECDKQTKELHHERDQLKEQIGLLRDALELTFDQAIKGRTFPATSSPTAWFNAVPVAIAAIPITFDKTGNKT